MAVVEEHPAIASLNMHSARSEQLRCCKQVRWSDVQVVNDGAHRASLDAVSAKELHKDIGIVPIHRSGIHESVKGLLATWKNDVLAVFQRLRPLQEE